MTPPTLLTERDRRCAVTTFVLCIIVILLKLGGTDLRWQAAQLRATMFDEATEQHAHRPDTVSAIAGHIPPPPPAQDGEDLAALQAEIAALKKETAAQQAKIDALTSTSTSASATASPTAAKAIAPAPTTPPPSAASVAPVVPLVLDAKAYKPPAHVRLACASSVPGDMVAHFTVMHRKPGSCASLAPTSAVGFSVRVWAEDDGPRKTFAAERVGCFEYDGEPPWEFYAAALQLGAASFPGGHHHTFKYRIGQLKRGGGKGRRVRGRSKDADLPTFVMESDALFFQHTAMAGGSSTQKIAVVGDVDFGSGGKSVIKSMSDMLHLDKLPEDRRRDRRARRLQLPDHQLRGGYGLVIHVGDASYATNNGGCYGDSGWLPDGHKCRYDCEVTKTKSCSGRSRQGRGQMEKWAAWLTTVEEITSHVPFVTTQGNHDNDLQWFLKFRPPINSSAPGVWATDLHHDQLRALPRAGTTEEKSLPWRAPTCFVPNNSAIKGGRLASVPP